MTPHPTAARKRIGSSWHDSYNDPCRTEIGGSRRIGRLLDPSERSPPRDIDPLVCLLADRPDGVRGVLAELLDVPGDLGTLLGGMLMLTVDGLRA
jgi:hypothetical protein